MKFRFDDPFAGRSRHERRWEAGRAGVGRDGNGHDVLSGGRQRHDWGLLGRLVLLRDAGPAEIDTDEGIAIDEPRPPGALALAKVSPNTCRRVLACSIRLAMSSRPYLFETGLPGLAIGLFRPRDPR